MQGPLTKGGYVPEQHTDFVFSAVGEQFGLLGCGGVLALYALLIVRVLRVAQISRDHLGSLLCCGVAAALLWHVFQNVGMTMGIMPITGHPPAVHLLRRLVDHRLLRHDRPGAERPHAPLVIALDEAVATARG